jgi:hypothetical protein
MPLDLDDNPADDRRLVVVGFDGSEAAARAIAAETTLMAGAEVLVVCVYRPLLDRRCPCSASIAAACHRPRRRAGWPSTDPTGSRRPRGRGACGCSGARSPTR